MPMMRASRNMSHTTSAAFRHGFLYIPAVGSVVEGDFVLWFDDNNTCNSLSYVTEQAFILLTGRKSHIC